MRFKRPPSHHHRQQQYQNSNSINVNQRCYSPDPIFALVQFNPIMISNELLSILSLYVYSTLTFLSMMIFLLDFRWYSLHCSPHLETHFSISQWLYSWISFSRCHCVYHYSNVYNCENRNDHRTSMDRFSRIGFHHV